MSVIAYDSVILIADYVENHSDATIQDATLERPDRKYFEQVYKSLKCLGLQVLHITEPDEIHTYAGEDYVLLSIWSGIGSKFRKATVPSMCELFKVPYLGSDPYVSLISQDKSLSKEVAKKYGIESAKGFLVSNVSNQQIIPKLTPPLIVKPNFEGGSIGINDECLVGDLEKALDKSKELLANFGGEVLIEEYIEGKEVSFVVVGNSDGIKFIEAVEIYFEEDPELLSKTIYSLEKKKAKSANLTTTHRLVTDEVPEELMAKVRHLFFGLQKCEIIRIDGRFSKDGFKLIELTPDPHIGQNATFYSAFRLKGLSHLEMMSLILSLG